MIKVIVGKYRTRVLETPPSVPLPTKNMVRGAMMSALGDSLANAKVLDLFAGSGALGIEALSRGASDAVFCDHSLDAAKVINGNLKKLGEQRMVYPYDYKTALDMLKGKKEIFDIVFLDPPYKEKDAYQYAVSFLLDNEMLAHDACIVLEYEGDIEVDVSPFEFQRTYRYGKTNVMLLRRHL